MSQIGMTLSKAPERQIIVVDGFYQIPDDIRQFALQQTFAADLRYFKGKRTKGFLFPGIKESFENLLGKTIKDWETGVNANGVFQFCTAEDPIVYHSDGQQWAGIIYLTPDAPPEAGTTLYRSKQFKGRTVEESLRRHHWQATPREDVEKGMFQNKLYDKTAWETVDVIGNVYNRLLLWNAKLVHAASCYFGHDKFTARMHQIFFFST